MSHDDRLRFAGDTGRRRQSARRRRVRVTAAVLLVAVTTGVVVGVVDGRHGGRSSRGGPSGAFEVVTTCLSVVGVVVVGVTWWWAWRTGALHRARQSPLGSLERAERRQVTRRVRGRLPADPQHLPVCVETARAMVAQRWIVVLWVGVALTTVSQLATPHPLVVHVVSAVGAGCLLLAAAQTLADSHRARRFLERHDISEAGQPDHPGGGA